MKITAPNIKKQKQLDRSGQRSTQHAVTAVGDAQLHHIMVHTLIRLFVLALVLGRVNFHISTLPPTPQVVASKVSLSLQASSPVQISRYDDIIRKTAKLKNIDWRLITSIIAVESSFRHHVTSKAGAQGLMQLMPAVLEEQAIDDGYHPELNVTAGTRHFIRWLNLIEADSGRDQLQMALAAYNAGLGHLRDAQRLTHQQGGNSRSWQDIAKAFRSLESPQFYSKARYGYCQGRAVIAYVNKVVELYDQYRYWYDIRSGYSQEVTASAPESL